MDQVDPRTTPLVRYAPGKHRPAKQAKITTDQMMTSYRQVAPLDPDKRQHRFPYRNGRDLPLAVESSFKYFLHHLILKVPVKKKNIISNIPGN